MPNLDKATQLALEKAIEREFPGASVSWHGKHMYVQDGWGSRMLDFTEQDDISLRELKRRVLRLLSEQSEEGLYENHSTAPEPPRDRGRA